MITLNRLEWSNFRSYGVDNCLTLNSRILTQLLGSNGAGKTTIPIMLQEVLYGKNIKSIKKCYVGVFDEDTQDYVGWALSENNGYYELTDLNVSNISVLIFTFSNHAQVYDSRNNNNNWGIGWTHNNIAPYVDDFDVLNAGKDTVKYLSNSE